MSNKKTLGQIAFEADKPENGYSHEWGEWGEIHEQVRRSWNKIAAAVEKAIRRRDKRKSTRTSR